MSQARRGGAVAAVAGAPGALLGQLEELLGMGDAAVGGRRGRIILSAFVPVVHPKGNASTYSTVRVRAGLGQSRWATRLS